MRRWLLATLAAAACGAQAASLQIVVTDKDGRPAADVVVLVDAPGRPATNAVPSPVPVVIAQEGLRFVPFLTVVAAGSTLRFVNRDGYDHHVRSMPSGPLGSTPPAKAFELRLDAAADATPPADAYAASPQPRRRAGAGSSADVAVERPGPIGLGCHLHGSMRGQVYVSPTPFFAKTDADGRAHIDNLPDGAIELSLWHADQLLEQPVQRLQAGAAPLVANAQLNFVPRRRR